MHSPIKQTEPKYVEIFDLNDIREEPARVVCSAINSVIEPLVDDPSEFFKDRLGVSELVKDVETHALKRKPRLITLSKETMGVSIDVFDYKKKRSHHNRLGAKVLKQMFGEDFTSSIEGEVYRGHLFIKTDHSPLETAA